LTLGSYAQIDYLEYKKKYNLSCGTPDSTLIVENQNLLEALKYSEISEGKQQFLYDYGWVYYMRYLKWKEQSDLETAASSFDKGWEDFNDLNALWNLGTIYRKLDNCPKALSSTETYLENVPDSINVNYKQVYYRYKLCCGSE
jgi:tetratricopeptide (TPR) repeat protein